MNPRLKIRAYKRLAPRVFERLYYGFTFQEGGLRPALQENRMMYILVAYYNKKIVGWSGMYRGFYAFDDREKYSLGVYVDEKFRHFGIGGKLKRKALVWALRHNLRTIWYDKKEAWMCVEAKSEHTGVSRALDERGIGQAVGQL